MVLCLTASGHQMVRVLRPPIHTDSSSTLGSDQTTNTNGLVINSTPFLLLSSVTPFTGDDVLEATGQDLKAPISRWTLFHANPKHQGSSAKGQTYKLGMVVVRFLVTPKWAFYILKIGPNVQNFWSICFQQ